MIRKFFSNYSLIIKNTGYLSVLEILKLMMPFIALPYLIRVIGGEKYGIIAFVQTIISYFSIFINFGLDISAVRSVALARNDKVLLSEIVSSILSIKFVLWIISLVLLIFSYFFIPFVRENILLICFAFLACVADVLFPAWYYQGIEKMKYITFIRFFSILFYTCSIFIFIKKAEDYIYIPLLQSLGLLISGFISIFLLIKADDIKLSYTDVSTVKKYFKESLPFFISRLSLLFNSGIAKIICGVFFSMNSVGAFDIAQKIAMAAFVPLQMVNQAIYPHLARTRDKLFARRGLWFMVIASFTLVTLLYFITPYAVHFFAGDELTEAVPLLRILCIYIFAGGISLYLGTPVLIAFGKSKPFNLSVILSSAVLLACYFIFYITNNFIIYNFAFILGLTELFIMFYRFYFCLKYKLLSPHVARGI